MPSWKLTSFQAAAHRQHALGIGKTQTNLPWGHRPGDPDPTVWQHDLYRPDRTPYRQAELDLFRALINQVSAPATR